MSFQQVLTKYRKLSFSEHDKGTRFEELMQAYLRTDPRYAEKFKKVWLWKEFPGKLDLGGTDTGIDLVALTVEGDYWAIQCKCYQEDSVINKPEVDSFLSTSGREFKNENYETTRFSHRLWISTTNRWGPNATEAIRNQNPPVARLSLFRLMDAPVDWDKLEQGVHGEPARTPKKSLYDHQNVALQDAHTHFQSDDRGKLIMACGTGKTFTSLRIAEHETEGKGTILFLVPSIALLGQTLGEWSADANEAINPICVCSDPAISKQKKKNLDTDSFSVVDLAYPATTDEKKILQQFQRIRDLERPGMTVVFSTYQSIDVVAKAQNTLLKNGFGEFDLIICDEAHRTTGVSLAGEDESAFVKVHNNDFIRAKKRMYMTATPRLYSDDAKSRAAEADAVLASMDDPALYGNEIYRIGFGEAVERNLLTDYKVLILTLYDGDVPPAVQQAISDEDYEINTDDASKLVGCINALSKQFLGDDGKTKESDPEPMRRAVAFCQNIKTSKKITATYNAAGDKYLDALPPEKREQMVSVSSKHMDGTMGAPQRDELLGWLKGASENNECRILTNVRVLSEGVDVPSLDAVLFLSARNSQVDVVQSVGRVMRRAEGKNYGYIVIPVVVPSDIEADRALNNNERYKVVWTVLNALRAHDDRFNATVNKIELNKERPNQILVGRPEYSFDNDGAAVATDDRNSAETNNEISRQLALKFEQLQSVVFARMVEKVGDRRYWEQWARDVAEIAARQIGRINDLIKTRPDQRQAFGNFLTGLQKNINPSIDEAQAVEMLAQHIITKPIFEALFEDYSFIKHNAVSNAMQRMLDELEGPTVAAESETLQKFYESVRTRAEGIDNADGKLRILIELYDKFFKNAFPSMVEQLGIVYTPVEAVDFIIQSVEHVLQSELGRNLTDENIHILDPFTGMGTFILRLLQNGLIKKKDLPRKYHHEIHANEIVLLAYYIAAVNIENAYHDQLSRNSEYESFDGIVLTDTFQLGETGDGDKLFSEMFPQNSDRVAKQRKAPVRVIIGNPPYSVGQRSANDNAQNQKYEHLERRIADTYAKASTATLQNSLYDSYIKAFRWSTDRLDPGNGGVVAFISNGAWLDGNATAGFRKVIEKEYSSIWVFNLRGNQRTSGELSRREGGKIFGSGSRTPIAITILVKNPEATSQKATIHYCDIGDYLSREEKLNLIRKYGSVANPEMDWKVITPNEHGDWISQRNSSFEEFIPLGDKKDKTNQQTFFIPVFSNGLKTQRDAWCYNSDRDELKENIRVHLDFYNEQRAAYWKLKRNDANLSVKEFLKRDPTRGSWTRALEADAERGKEHSLSDGSVKTALYRPFFKQHLYFSHGLNEVVGQMPKLFPDDSAENKVICVSGNGATKTFSVLMTDQIPDVQLEFNGQCFPLYYYEEQTKSDTSLFDQARESEYVRRDAVTDFILERGKQQYGKNVTKEDLFYYVYGLLHSPVYREAFTNDLKKMLPRVPLVEDVRDFWKFSKAGRKLAKLHIDYENVPPHEEVIVDGADAGNYRVEKMRFPAKGKKDTIIYNDYITVSNIPEKAYQYVVNGKSAIEWVMERYQITTHKDSGIRNDPNDWADEVGNKWHILDLLLSVINVSVQTVDIVESLPRLDFD